MSTKTKTKTSKTKKLKVIDILTSPSKWCKGYFAKDKRGIKISERDEKAVRFCLVGAIHKCYEDDKSRKIFERILKTLRKEGKFTFSSDFNDSPKTRFADVRRLI